MSRKPSGHLLHTLRPARDRDEGFALPSVLALLLVAVVLVSAVTAVVLHASGSATSSRASVQAQASAEAGLDVARASVMAGALKCAFSSASAPAFTVQVTYAKASGAPVACDPATGTAPVVDVVTAVLVSTGFADSRGTQGNTSGDVRRLQGVMTAQNTSSDGAGGSSTPDAASTGTPTLAVFGDRGVTAQNQINLRESSPGKRDAGVYTNSGGVSCSNNAEVQGPVQSQGDVDLTNSCTFASVWAGGRVSLAAGATVQGDVLAASTSSSAVQLLNGNPRLQGNAYANGSVSLGDGSVSGSVLSTAGAISFKNGSTIGGSAYGADGVTYDGGGGRIGFDAVASHGTLAGPTSQNAREWKWSVGHDASAAGCIASSLSVGGTPNRPANAPGSACDPRSGIPSSLTFPATPGNPSGVPATPLPATVAAPPRLDFPTLPSRASGGTDPLDSWRSQGWDVQVFPRAGASGTSCDQAFAHLRKAVAPSTVERAAWQSKPLLLVIRDCSSAFQVDAENRALVDQNTLTLVNDLAIMSDAGITNQNPFKIASSVSGQVRNFYWIVPSDSAAVGQGRQCSLTPSGLQDLQDVRWFLYTPCTVQPSNNLGSSQTPLRGSVYGGSIAAQQVELQYAPMTVPGLSGGGVSSSAGTGGSSGGSSAPITRWSLTDVRDLARA